MNPPRIRSENHAGSRDGQRGAPGGGVECEHFPKTAMRSSASTFRRLRIPAWWAASLIGRWCGSASRAPARIVHTTTLHKPHVGTHDRQAFVDTNISGTLGLLEASAESGVKAFVFTSTTSAFGGALTPPPEAPAVWVTEDLEPAPRNIYGVTKTAAEDLSALLCRDRGLPCIILRTSRGSSPSLTTGRNRRTAFDDLNLKVNELLHRARRPARRRLRSSAGT